jgi:hypothetical protein
MNKAYFLIVALLVIATVAVGGFAIYKSIKPEMLKTTQSPLTNPKNTTNNKQVVNQTSQEQDKPVTNNMPLTISSPTINLETNKSILTVSGTTKPNADVTINEKEIFANSQGKFQTTITLLEGDNQIYILSSDDQGNYAEWNGSVVYTPSN